MQWPTIRVPTLPTTSSNNTRLGTKLKRGTTRTCFISRYLGSGNYWGEKRGCRREEKNTVVLSSAQEGAGRRDRRNEMCESRHVPPPPPQTSGPTALMLRGPRPPFDRALARSGEQGCRDRRDGAGRRRPRAGRPRHLRHRRVRQDGRVGPNGYPRGLAWPWLRRLVHWLVGWCPNCVARVRGCNRGYHVYPA